LPARHPDNPGYPGDRRPPGLTAQGGLMSEHT
jgi:hypothetical protein